MIFVTVGNAHQSFERLLSTVDRLSGEGVFAGEPVLMQKGNSHFEPQHSEAHAFLSMDLFERRAKEAKLIVCHGGCTVLQLLRMGKYPIVMPRQQRYGEHINDHQISFVRALAEAGHIVPAYEASDVREAVAKAMGAAGVPLPPSQMSGLVRTAVEELIGGKR
jgi:UDP-N-acetylglucosamine transferase subunit ALG13